MLRDLLDFEDAWKRSKGTPPPSALSSLLSFLGNRVGIRYGYDAADFPLGDPAYAGVHAIAEAMRRAGSIVSMHPVPSLPDEPRIHTWLVQFRDGEESRAMGGSPDDDVLALTIALAEAQERYLWVFADDYFEHPTIATIRDMAPQGIDPRRFVGYSALQRAENPALAITDDSSFRWIRGHSFVSEKDLFVPAAAMSRHRTARTPGEPQIRKIISTGLATYPDRTEALLRGALEVIERDAYMITWLNQLTLPRITLSELATSDQRLARLLEQCARYRLKTHAVRLLTDAPAHVICVVLEDESGLPPRYAFGLKAHRSLPRAVEGALIEALRVRRGIRLRLNAPDRPPRPTTVGHYDRHEYWSEGENHRKLAFFVHGSEERPSPAPWDDDTPAEHWQRIVSWCKEKGYECVSVPLTRSRMNVTPWHIEMVAIPDLQPIHYNEHLPHIGGARLSEVPRRFGYASLAPFTDEPHPFA